MNTEYLWLALHSYASSPPKLMKETVEAYGGDIEGLFHSSKSRLREILDEKSVELISNASTKLDEASAEWEKLRDMGVQLLTFTHPLYPKNLIKIPNFPPLLYAWGNIGLVHTTSIGICGSRQASVDGLRHARRFGKLAAELRLTVISGYARGTDTEAHLGALEGKGSTIVVLADGILNFRIKTDFKGFANLSDRLLVLSQFRPMQRWLVGTAMERNKVICGLTNGLVIVEAGASGGTLNAGRECLRQKKPLWVIQYQMPKETAMGNDILIREQAIPLRTENELKAALAKLAQNSHRVSQVS